MKRFNLKSFKADLLAVVLRFHVVLVFIFGLAVMVFREVNDKQFEQEFNVWSFFILGAFISLAVSLFLENTTHKLLRIIAFLLPILALGVYCFYLFNNKIEWEMMQFAAIALASILSIYFVRYFPTNTDSPFWIFSEKISCELITTLIYVSFLQGGLSLAIYAVDVLFNIKIENEVYGNLAICCYLIVAPVYFLMNIPSKEKNYVEAIYYSKFLKILGLYVFLPVLSIYIVILYFYLFKIIASWELPNGWVTTLVSVLALGGFLAKFLLFPFSENKIVKILNRYFSLILFPLIVLMSVGLVRRIWDYGLSINRLYVLVFNLWLYGASIYLFFTQSKHLRWLVISFATISLVASVGPWSVFAVTKRNVEKNLKTLLVENKLIVNGQLVDNKNNKIQIPDSIAKNIADKLYYYVSTFDIESWKINFNDNRNLKGVSDIVESLGVDKYALHKSSKYITIDLYDKKLYDIAGYRTMITNIEKSDKNDLLLKHEDWSINMVHNTIQITNIKQKIHTNFSLLTVILTLYENDNLQNKNAILIQKTENFVLIINRISVDYKTKSDFEIKELNVSLLLK
ncbi:MAG: hypothetical protein AUK44_02630 [Porphyromonadaceae bacterium CG2_30_38_12]|nr:MAG: hypothetical protein AUK44_02630 [Porphyromonadaceae bacterium CG2_30_38_12]